MSIKAVFIVVALGILFCEVNGGSGSEKLKIAAFNADTFGLTKFSNTEAVSILCKIVHRYDIILIEEIRDSTNTMIYSFLDIVNNCPSCSTTCTARNNHDQSLTVVGSGTTYNMSISERLGRTRNKEQYAFFYKPDRLEVLSTHQYADFTDIFEREPFSILIRSSVQGIPDFFLMGIRTKPSHCATFQELIALISDAYDQASSFFGTKDGLILGDFNADCSYLSQRGYYTLNLVINNRFTWLIDKDADTTTSSSNCAYDRILASGNINTLVVKGSAVVFPFDQEFGLSEMETNAVSNRYPVEVTLERRCNVLKIAAFNIQVFGRAKFRQNEVVSILSKIVHRYDLILIQDIRDSSETVIFKFLEVVNSVQSGVTYAVSVSERLGRTSSKEQYAFMYRTDKICLLSSYQYDDPDDVFEREPYSVLVQSFHSDIPNFFLVGVHIKPTDTIAELNALDDVYDKAALLFGTQNGVLFGNFNADCRYLSNTRYLELDLVRDIRFTWLIDNDVDTTIANSNCSYDRIIVSGDLLNYTVENSAAVFDFSMEYGLNKSEAERVSNHYPVEMTLTAG